MAEEIKPTTTQSEAVDPASALLAAVVNMRDEAQKTLNLCRMKAPLIVGLKWKLREEIWEAVVGDLNAIISTHAANAALSGEPTTPQCQ